MIKNKKTIFILIVNYIEKIYKIMLFDKKKIKMINKKILK